MSEETLAQIAQLETQIETLRESLNQERLDQRNQVTPKYAYTINKPAQNFDRVWDPSCVVYRIKSMCVNKDSAINSGWSEREITEGGMNYIFNTLSEKFVLAPGGGTVFISNLDGWSSTPDEEMLNTLNEVAAFVVANPDGGEITPIIEAHKARKAAYRASR